MISETRLIFGNYSTGAPVRREYVKRLNSGSFNGSTCSLPCSGFRTTKYKSLTGMSRWVTVKVSLRKTKGSGQFFNNRRFDFFKFSQPVAYYFFRFVHLGKKKIIFLIGVSAELFQSSICATVAVSGKRDIVYCRRKLKFLEELLPKAKIDT